MKSADEKEKLYLSLQRLTENTIEDIVNRSVNHKNMNNHNDLNINNKYKVLFVCLGTKKSFVEDIVFTLDAAGQIESLAFGLDDIATKDILSKQAWPENARVAIIEFLENYKTAFALERLEYIRTIFDDNAVIIVGKLATVASSVVPEYQTQYNNKVVIRTRYTKEQYLKS